jgi:hypothetical protein
LPAGKGKVIIAHSYNEGLARSPIANVQVFECDGRTQCVDMTSCDEATYFLDNCPNVKMDGDGDGVPCESQWCGN